ncbi:MAG: alpha-N-arabinofuranosidase [Balneola sp.]|nr:alpha-N-arabinofuranosidase [Balneola sp.]MBE79223.1 alpha-N-arabinofuranosidase [Balneola sp.]|tara:strand:+ start:12279 stop:13871 length:1593 start_codon:yes stop_codon:yes gene_type:complete
MKKLFLLLALTLFPLSAQVLAQSTIIVNVDQAEHTISEHIYGQFAEHLGRGVYEGIWVGLDSNIPNTEGYRTDVLEALQELQIPNIRWPGGCFADEYDWRDGIGPRSERPKTVNTHWGMVIDDNSFGTHEFLRFTELINAEPYISANVGSGTPAQMQDWLEYMTFSGDSELANLRRINGREEPWDIKFFGIGNESWGCGGNMTADYYADLYRRYQTYAKSFNDTPLYKIASGMYDVEYEWTETVMREAGNMMDAISLHYYTIPGEGWADKGPSKDFGEEMYYRGLKAASLLDEFITRHSDIMDQYDPEKNVALAVDEWGVWTNPLEGTNPGFLEQQNSLRDALIASLSLDIMNAHAERVKLANIAQTVNVLQAMIITDGADMFLTPTYHVFHFYKVHQNSVLLPIHIHAKKYEGPGDKEVQDRFELADSEPGVPVISATASRDKNRVMHFTVTNTHPKESNDVIIEIRGAEANRIVSGSGRLLTANSVDAVNTVNNPQQVAPVSFENARLRDGKLSLEIPPHSIVVISVE